jgi:hypothetical protein
VSLLAEFEVLNEQLVVDAHGRPRNADRLTSRQAHGDAPSSTSVLPPAWPSMVDAGDLPRPFPDTSRRVPSRSYVTGFVTAQWKTAGTTRIPAVLLCEEGDLNLYAAHNHRGLWAVSTRWPRQSGQSAGGFR